MTDEADMSKVCAGCDISGANHEYRGHPVHKHCTVLLEQRLFHQGERMTTEDQIADALASSIDAEFQDAMQQDELREKNPAQYWEEKYLAVLESEESYRERCYELEEQLVMARALVEDLRKQLRK